MRAVHINERKSVCVNEEFFMPKADTNHTGLLSEGESTFLSLFPINFMFIFKLGFFIV